MTWVREEAEASISGSGGHDVTYKVCCMLVHGFDLGDADLMSVLEAYNGAKCNPPWSLPELNHKLAGARNSASRYPKGWLYRKLTRAKGYWKPGTRRLGDSETGRQGEINIEMHRPKAELKWKLAFDLEALRCVQVPGLSVDFLWLSLRSPVDVETVTSEQFLDLIFGPEAMVLVFTKFGSQGQYMRWRGRTYLLADRPGLHAKREIKLYGGKIEPVVLPTKAPDGAWYLSQPVDGAWHANPREMDARTGRPKMSRRSEESVKAWEHLVLEADPVEDIKKDAAKMAEFERLWLGFLCKLPLPIKAIYTSGGKSIHALVHVPQPTKERFDAMKRMIGPLFSKLGADAAAMKAVQLTRLPGVMRGTKLQRLLYLDPNPDPAGVPLCEMRAPTAECRSLNEEEKSQPNNEGDFI